MRILNSFIRGNLFTRVEEAMKVIMAHIGVRYEFGGKLRRGELWDYPLDALREAVINALIHKDYTDPSSVQIKVFDDFLRKDIYTEDYLRKLGLNERQIRAVLYVKEKGSITNKGYQNLFSVSRQTATRDLSDLVKLGFFDRVERGRYTKDST